MTLGLRNTRHCDSFDKSETTTFGKVIKTIAAQKLELLRIDLVT